MADAETRALWRAAVLLLSVSTFRWGWTALSASPPLPAGPDVLPGLLAASQEETEEAARRARPLSEGEKIDPNRAPEAELDRLPGVGPATAKAIVASREADGPFRGPADLGRVKGIGPALVARLEAHLELDGSPAQSRPERRPGPRAGPVGGRDPPRVDVNRAEAEELETLPGIGPALAARIVESRVKKPFRAVEDLLGVPGIGPATLERLRARVRVGP